MEGWAGNDSTSLDRHFLCYIYDRPWAHSALHTALRSALICSACCDPHCVELHTARRSTL
eukprot:117459-Chlamydomonas_euryale.AAC.1